jgi:hypothetical protein
MIKLKLLIFLVFFSFSSFSQQERRISGVVLEAATNQPLPSAAIFIKGTKKGVTADFNGKFSYIVKSKEKIENIILQISYVGYLKQEIKLVPHLFLSSN